MTIFWAALLLLAYIYIGYPLLVSLRAALRPRHPHQADIEPTVSIVVVAYNEEARIETRIQNLLALDYPREKIEIIVGSDGSTDLTVEIARRYEHDGVIVRPFIQRRGKPAVLNALVPTARGELVLFADARQRFDSRALRALVADLADPGVGAVSGELMLTTNERATVAQGAGFYWRYEKRIRSAESRCGSTLGATGAIYAIRRDLFEPIPEDTILDDVVIPTRMVKRGYRVLFEPDAVAFDEASSTAAQEFSRKARTIAGTFQLFARESWLLSPLRNRLWFETVSHKGLRLLLPLLHIAVFAASAALLDRPFGQVVFAGQIMFYAAALAGWSQRRARRRILFLTIPYTIALLCWATAVGFARFATNRQQVTWERVPPQESLTKAPRKAHL